MTAAPGGQCSDLLGVKPTRVSVMIETDLQASRTGLTLLCKVYPKTDVA